MFRILKKNKVEPQTWYVLVSASFPWDFRTVQLDCTNIFITNRLTERQRNATKYNNDWGYIKEFSTKEEATAFAKIAKLKEPYI